MVFSLPKNITIYELQEPLQELDIPSILFLSPVQWIKFFGLLGTVLKSIFTFARLEEPRLDLLKRAGILGVPEETGAWGLWASLGKDFCELAHGGSLLYYLIKLSRHHDSSHFNFMAWGKSIVLQVILSRRIRRPFPAPKWPFLMKSGESHLGSTFPWLIINLFEY